MKTFNFKFVKNAPKAFIVSLCIIIATVIVAVVLGVKMDIQFTGGSMISYSYSGEIDASKVENSVGDLLKRSCNVQKKESATGNSFVITMSGNENLSDEQQKELTQMLEKDYAANEPGLLEVNNVSPTIGREFFLRCLASLVLASVCIIIYIAIRFRKIGGWLAGMTSVVALVHDVIMVFAVFVIFRIPLDANFIAVALTILGYSINDTIVIFDRVRENRSYNKKISNRELVDLSMNQTFTRSINASLTTIMVMVIVTIMALIFDVNSILTFSFPMIVGMLFGVYSTLFFAAPLWVMWHESREKKSSKKTEKVEA